MGPLLPHLAATLLALPQPAAGDLVAEPIAPPAAAIAVAETAAAAIGLRWQRADDPPATLPLPVFDAVAIEADGRLAVLGGADASLRATAAIQLHDPRHGWLPIGSQLSTPRAEATSLRLPCGRLLVLGGWQGRLGGRGDEAPRHLDDGEILDPLVAGSGFLLPSFGGSLEGHSATLDAAGGVIVVAGGLARRLDPASGRWSDAVPIDPPRRHHAALPDGAGGVLLFGGVGGPGEAATPPTRIDRVAWEAARGRLEVVPTGLSIPEPLAHAAAIDGADGSTVLLVGGIRPLSGSTSARSWRIDLAEGAIRPGPPLPDPRGAARFSVVPHRGGVALLGGEWRDGSARGASELSLLLDLVDLDGSPGAFSPLPPLPPAGSRRLAIARSSGAIELIGGYRFTGRLDAAATGVPPGVEVSGIHLRLAEASEAISAAAPGD